MLSHSVVASSLPPSGLLLTRFPCPPLSPGACSDSCQWCQPTISSSVVPFSSCLQSFPAAGSFQWVSSSHQVIWWQSSCMKLQRNQSHPVPWKAAVSHWIQHAFHEPRWFQSYLTLRNETIQCFVFFSLKSIL